MRQGCALARQGRRLTTDLPIEACLTALIAALEQTGQAVLQAPPGAGKTTRVPLAMLESGLVKGRILMLEPRRLATRAAAERMAEMLGEETGATIGYRIRGEAVTGPATRIEVVTEGILTRMIQSDPELTGIGAILFDEFHERSIHADFGLALSLEIRAALRPDLILLVMSATLDTAPVAALMGGAPVVTSEGRAFAVDTRWLARSWRTPQARGPRFEQAVADLVMQALSDAPGSALVFLPGEGEIRRVEGLLSGRVPADVAIRPLFGALPFRDQRAAIVPAETGRKVVLATSIAETSLTIDGVRIVVDAGRSRRARYDPGSGMARLVTERVSRAEADQRRGRAGRLAEGVCYRMWTKGEEGGLAPFAPPEIAEADLAPLVLDCAAWGESDPTRLAFLTVPPAAALAEARTLLLGLGAIDAGGAITGHGRAMAALPLHPRLAHMVLLGGRDAPLLAALLAERDILAVAGQRPPSDLSLRLEAARNPARFEASHAIKIDRGSLSRVHDAAKRMRPRGPARSLAEMAALAYPDRIGLRRPGDAPRYVLSGGRGAVFAEGDPTGQAPMIVATDLDGGAGEATIRTAAILPEPDFRALFKTGISEKLTCFWSRRDRAVLARRQETFGALILSDRPWQDCPQERVAQGLLDGLRDLGLGALDMSRAARLLIARVEFLRARGADQPDFSEAGLIESAADWLAPWFGKARTAQDLGRIDIHAALLAHLTWAQRQQLDHLAPAAITAPTGTRLGIDYGGDQPSVSVRLQEMFGLTRHPTIGPDHVPLLIDLLSPARRPVQTTADLPGFWASSYADVRKDMRGRYPKHSWPEDPTEAAPTTRVKPRGT